MAKVRKLKYYDFYVKCMKSGRIPDVENGKTSGGLCSIFPDVQIFKPTNKDCDEYHVDYELYWASNDEHLDDIDIHDHITKFNEFRQNIILFLAAINNEL